MTVGDALREQFFSKNTDVELSNILWEAGFCPQSLSITFSRPPMCRECGPCCDGILKEEYVPKIHSGIFTLIRNWNLLNSLKNAVKALEDIRNDSSPEDEAEFWYFSTKALNELNELINNSKYKGKIDK